MYKDTITLFNRKEGDNGDTWFPTVLRNVHLNMDKAAILAKYGPQSVDNASLNVRFRNESGRIMIGGKEWLSPKAWEQAKDHSAAITFTSGSRFDFFWFGDWGNEEPVHDSAYFADTDFYTYMNRTHDYVFAVSSVGGPYSTIPHFEILGK